MAAARAVALSVVMCLLPRIVQAEPSRRPALHWVRLDGAESCIDPRSLAQRVEGITGSVFVDAASADTSIEARIELVAPGSFTVHVKLASTSDTRVASFTTESCRSLDNAIAFLIAMTIDPDLAVSPFAGVDWMRPDGDPAAEAELLRRDLATQPAPARSGDVQPPVPVLPTPPPRATPPRRARAPMPLQLEAAVGGGYGPTSSPTAGFAASLTFGISELFALGAQLRAAAATSAYNLDGVRSVSTQSVGLSLFACTTLFDPRVLALHACAGPELTLLIATGDGFMEDASTTLPSGGAVVKLQVLHQLSKRWSLLLATVGALDVGQRTVYFLREGSQVDVFVPDRFSFQLLLGAARAF